MSVLARMNATIFHRKAALAARGSADARTVVVKEMAGQVVRVGLALAPRDTHRFANALAQAGRGAGVSGAADYPLRPGKWARKARRVLERQVSFWEFVCRGYEKDNRTREKYYGKAKRRLAAAQRELLRVDPTAVYINLFQSRGKIARAISTVYGGNGRVLRVGEQSYVILHNKEPHASLVERRFKVMGRAVASVRAQGVRGFGRKFAGEIARESGFKLR